MGFEEADRVRIVSTGEEGRVGEIGRFLVQVVTDSGRLRVCTPQDLEKLPGGALG